MPESDWGMPDEYRPYDQEEDFDTGRTLVELREGKCGQEKIVDCTNRDRARLFQHTWKEIRSLQTTLFNEFDT